MPLVIAHQMNRLGSGREEKEVLPETEQVIRLEGDHKPLSEAGVGVGEVAQLRIN